jgi:ribosomal protein S18 acetylase RimI-like enzyme
MILLTRSQDVDFGIAEEADIDAMAQLLAGVFSRFDPPAVAAGVSFDEFLELAKSYGRRAPDDGLTVIARLQSTGELIGAMLTDDFASPPPARVEPLAEHFKPIVALLEGLDQRFRQFHQVTPGRYLHLFLLGVAPEFGGRGIAHTLVRLTLENGRHKGYERAVTEATGNVSQHIFRNHGFIERFRIPYREFEYNGKCIFNTIVDHDSVMLLERHLVV